MTDTPEASEQEPERLPLYRRLREAARRNERAYGHLDKEELSDLLHEAADCALLGQHMFVHVNKD